jgi:hypothetical protein
MNAYIRLTMFASFLQSRQIMNRLKPALLVFMVLFFNGISVSFGVRTIQRASLASFRWSITIVQRMRGPFRFA